VRRNAGLWAPQRHGQGWALGAWFTPVLFLWFPFQMLGDVWRASEPAPASRRGTDPVAKAWWACWTASGRRGLHPGSRTPLPASNKCSAAPARTPSTTVSPFTGTGPPEFRTTRSLSSPSTTARAVTR
jgi:hypothetical protein